MTETMPQMPEVPAMDMPAAPAAQPELPTTQTGVPETNPVQNQPGTQPNTQPGTQPNTQPGIQPGTQPNTQQTRQNSLEIVGRVSFPSTQLFEVTGFIDISRSFPSSNAFLMFVPGKQDPSKATGRTYVQEQKETMKIMTRDLYALAEALKFAAMYKKNPGFMIFTDSSKFAGNQGPGVTKQVSVTVAPSNRDPNKFTVFLSYKGQQKITIAMEEWHAIGLAGQLINLANETEKRKFQIEKQLMQQPS